jgi:hypothetical protein
MSDKTSETRSARGGPGLILGGLAASAILGTPVVPVAAEPVAAASASAASRSSCGAEIEAVESIGSSIREQFRTSFTAGAVTDPAMEPSAIMIICDPS